MSLVDHRLMQGNEAGTVRVLVVDDAPCFREAARSLLEDRGFVVAGEADCAATAREAVKRLAPDAILLDVNLPDANGFELAAELLSSDPAIAILLVSADETLRDVVPEDFGQRFVAKSRLAGADLAEFWPAST